MYYNIFFMKGFVVLKKSPPFASFFSGAPLLGDMEFFWDITEGGQNTRAGE